MSRRRYVHILRVGCLAWLFLHRARPSLDLLLCSCLNACGRLGVPGCGIWHRSRGADRTHMSGRPNKLGRSEIVDYHSCFRPCKDLRIYIPESCCTWTSWSRWALAPTGLPGKFRFHKRVFRRSCAACDGLLQIWRFVLGFILGQRLSSGSICRTTLIQRLCGSRRVTGMRRFGRSGGWVRLRLLDVILNCIDL